MSHARSVSEVDRQIGTRVRLRRLELGMTQEVLSTRIGVTFQQLQKYEKGVNRLPAPRMRLVAEALGVRIGELFSVEPEPELKLRATEGARELIRLWGRLPARTRHSILALVKVVAEASESGEGDGNDV